MLLTPIAAAILSHEAETSPREQRSKGIIVNNPSNAIAIRPANTADLPRIGFLGDMLVEVHNAFDAERFIATRPRTPADYAAFMGTQLGKPDVAIFVAHINDDVIGYAYCAVEGFDYMQLRGPAGVVHDIIVDPEYRGQGVGKQLLDASLSFLRSHNAPRVVLTTADRNAPALRLFENAGFRRTMVEMTRELNSAP
jgi:ribosomal protein S18 acetylase RimI-like enzyme